MHVGALLEQGLSEDRYVPKHGNGNGGESGPHPFGQGLAGKTLAEKARNPGAENGSYNFV